MLVCVGLAEWQVESCSKSVCLPAVPNTGPAKNLNVEQVASTLAFKFERKNEISGDRKVEVVLMFSRRKRLHYAVVEG